MLVTIFEVWDKLPVHAQIIVGVSTVVASLVRPTIALIKWMKENKRRRLNGGIDPEAANNRENDTLVIPFSIKISPHSRKVRWYKDKLRNHNLFFQLDELIKYEIDTNKFTFGDNEKTRLFRQLLRIYLGVLHETIKKPLEDKINLDRLTDKEISELISDYVQEINIILYKKFKESFTDEFFDLVIMNQDKGFTYFIEKHKRHLLTSVREIVKQEKKLFDGTNYRKLWDVYSLIRLLLNVGLDLFVEFFEEFNGDLDKILKH